MSREGILTLAGAGLGASPSMDRWLSRRLAEASLLIHDGELDSRTREQIGDDCETLSLEATGLEIQLINPAQVRERIRSHLQDGETVVRLYEESLLLSETAFDEIRRFYDTGIPFEALAGHLFLEDRSMEWRAQTILHAGGSLVLSMVAANVRQIRDTLEGGEYPDSCRAAFLREGAGHAERHPLGTPARLGRWFREEERSLSGLVLLGQESRLPRAARWFSGLPLLGARIVVTRAEEPSERLASLISEMGGVPLPVPTIEILPPDWAKLDASIEDIESFDWLVFTSRNGVKHFFERLLARGKDARAIGSLRLACVGSGTAEALHDRGLHPDLVPEEFHQEPLAELLRPEAEGARFLLPLAHDHRDALPEILSQAGADVIIAEAYRKSAPPDIRTRWEQAVFEGIDAVAFTSSSTVRNLSAGLGSEDLSESLGGALVACIGPVTASTARAHGLHPADLPGESTLEGLTKALIRALDEASGS